MNKSLAGDVRTVKTYRLRGWVSNTPAPILPRINVRIDYICIMVLKSTVSSTATGKILRSLPSKLGIPLPPSPLPSVVGSLTVRCCYELAKIPKFGTDGPTKQTFW